MSNLPNFESMATSASPAMLVRFELELYQQQVISDFILMQSDTPVSVRTILGHGKDKELSANEKKAFAMALRLAGVMLSNQVWALINKTGKHLGGVNVSAAD